MTDKEITSLAREYAEEITKADAGDPNLSASDLNGIKHDVAEYAEQLIRGLLRRFCLVEKSKVKDAYMSARKDIKDGYKSKIGGMIAMGEVKGALLESLFPEIAKEVEL